VRPNGQASSGCVGSQCRVVLVLLSKRVAKSKPRVHKVGVVRNRPVEKLPGLVGLRGQLKAQTKTRFLLEKKWYQRVVTK